MGADFELSPEELLTKDDGEHARKEEGQESHSLPMMTLYAPGQPGIDHADASRCAELAQQAIWIELFEPSSGEEAALEAAFGLGVPTREEMRSLELSSRLYRRQDALYLTATVLTGADTAFPESSAVTFVLAVKLVLPRGRVERLC